MRSNTWGALAPVPLPEPPSGQPELLQVKPDKRKPRGPYIVLLIFFACVAAGAWFMLHPPAKTPKPMEATRSAKVRLAAIQRTLRLSGVTVAGRFSMLLTPQMTGTRMRGGSEFQQVLVSTAKPGSHVRKGDVVAEFDRMYMMLRLEDYKSSVVQNQANLRSLNALLDVRRQSYAQQTIRYRGARDKAALETQKAPVLSANRAENDRLNLEQYQSQLKEIVEEERLFETSEKASIRRSELNLDVARLELQRAQRNADGMLVKAPIDGMVVMQTIRHGSDFSEIQAGDQLYPGQPVVQIVDTSSILVDATVNQVDVDEIRVGAPARVSFDAYPGLELPARVVSIGAMANAKGWRAAYVKDVLVRLALDKLDDRVIPNFSVAADVVLEETPEVTTMPRESVFTDPADGHTVAFVKGATGWEKREVEIGTTNNLTAEVKAGLSAGDVVATEWVAEPQEAPQPPK